MGSIIIISGTLNLKRGSIIKIPKDKQSILTINTIIAFVFDLGAVSFVDAILLSRKIYVNNGFVQKVKKLVIRIFLINYLDF